MTSLADYRLDALLPFIATVALKITLLLGAAFVASRWLASATAAVRHLLWAWTLAGCLALPWLQLAMPPLEWKILPPLGEVNGTREDPVRRGDRSRNQESKVRSQAASVSRDGQGFSDAGSAELSLLRLSPHQSLLAAYWIVSGGLLAYLLIGLWRLSALRRQSRPAPPGSEWESLLGRLRRDVGMKRAVALRFSERIGTPIAWGVLRPVVLLPDSAEHWASS